MFHKLSQKGYYPNLPTNARNTRDNSARPLCTLHKELFENY